MIDAELCVACLACVRVCPTDAIAVAAEEPLLLQIDDDACIRCGQCLPACPHGAIKVNGEIGRALAIASQGDGVLILSPESVAHFYPATPEQVINACYAAGFRAVTRGVIGDELVAAEYLKLWEEEPWGTLIRSTDPVVVDTVRTAVPRARALPGAGDGCRRWRRPDTCERSTGLGSRLRSPGSVPRSARPSSTRPSPSATWTRSSGSGASNVLSQPIFFERVPEERRRHLSAAGGLPLALLEEARYSSRRFRKLRGLDALKAVARAVAVDRLDLGFVDILSHRGVAGPPAVGTAGGAVLAPGAVGQHRAAPEPLPVVDQSLVASVGATFEIKPRRGEAGPGGRWPRSWTRSAWGPTAGPGTAGPAASTPASGSPRRRRWDGPRCGSARPTRSAGRTRPSGRRRWTRSPAFRRTGCCATGWRSRSSAASGATRASRSCSWTWTASSR